MGVRMAAVMLGGIRERVVVWRGSDAAHILSITERCTWLVWSLDGSPLPLS